MRILLNHAYIFTEIFLYCGIVIAQASLQDLGIWQPIRARRSMETNAIAVIDTDSKLASQSDMDLPWEKFIVNGPSTVNLLGQLMVVSSKLDFSFRDFQPDYQFQYIRFPNSFRATLTQIANDGWEAFLGAHINMNKIQASMELVPKQVLIVLQVLASQKSTPRIIGMLLPTTLKEIERLGKTCVTLANATHVSFLTVMSLIGEVISSTENARGLQETRLRQVEIELNVSRVMQTELTKLGETIRSHYDDARAAVQKAQQEYSTALRKIPTGFKALLLDLGRAVVGLVKTAGQALTSLAMTSMAGPIAGPIAGAIAGPGLSAAVGQSLTFGKLFTDSLNKAVPRFKEILTSGEKILSGSVNPKEELQAYKVTFQTFLSSIAAGKDNRLKRKASSIISESLQLLNETEDRTNEGITSGEGIDKNAARDLSNRFDSLLEEAKPMAAAEEINGATVPPAPGDPSAGGRLDPSGDSSQNEKFAAQLSLNRLQSAESRYDKIFDDLKQNQQELAKLMGKISSLDMTRINYKEILELLREALILLSRVREQWGQLVLFFAEVATRAEITLSGTLGPFISQATQAGTEGLSLDERFFYVDLLKAQAKEIDSQSHMLFVMSRTYVDMSSNFIMGRLAGLSKMLTARDDYERNKFLAELNAESKNTQEAIEELIHRRKSNYQVTMRKRQAELENFIAKLGGPNLNDLAAIDAGKALLDTLNK